MKNWRNEHGAAAVEFALVLPVLLLLVLGTVEFGRAYNTQITLTQAARESVRTLAISNNSAAATARARTSAPSLNPALTDAQVSVSFADSTTLAARTACGTGSDAIVTITYPFQTLTGITGSINLKAKAVMRCAG